MSGILQPGIDLYASMNYHPYIYHLTPSFEGAGDHERDVDNNSLIVIHLNYTQKVTVTLYIIITLLTGD